jgi:hypothetical protein
MRNFKREYANNHLREERKASDRNFVQTILWKAESRGMFFSVMEVKRIIS